MLFRYNVYIYVYYGFKQINIFNVSHFDNYLNYLNVYKLYSDIIGALLPVLKITINKKKGEQNISN